MRNYTYTVHRCCCNGISSQLAPNWDPTTIRIVSSGSKTTKTQLQRAQLSARALNYPSQCRKPVQHAAMFGIVVHQEMKSDSPTEKSRQCKPKYTHAIRKGDVLCHRVSNSVLPRLCEYHWSPEINLRAVIHCQQQGGVLHGEFEVWYAIHPSVDHSGIHKYLRHLP
jgi:hypothetical protein